jgi:hypothetical protein
MTEFAGLEADINPGHSRYARGTMSNYDLKPSSECAMNKGAPEHFAFRNKNKSAFEGRHNPA